MENQIINSLLKKLRVDYRPKFFIMTIYKTSSPVTQSKKLLLDAHLLICYIVIVPVIDNGNDNT
ncbi:MAG: hypothetical protein CL609_09700 [Anaerolineaceae bacterium]|nr:hypothetical protein [Anaerolineaceae bacterium]